MSSPIARQSVRRHHRGGPAAGFSAVAAACLALSPPLSANEPPSTTVTPAGHEISASLVDGTFAEFVVGAVNVRCTTSTTLGQVPAAPGNHNAAGPVVTAIRPPLFESDGGSCTTSVLLTRATMTANEGAGQWRIAWQYGPAGSVGILTVPQAGIVTTTRGLASCRITTAPNGPVTLTGRFIAATPTSPAKLDFSGVSVPIQVTGGLGCPTDATSSFFRATYALTDTTGPTQTVAIGP